MKARPGFAILAALAAALLLLPAAASAACPNEGIRAAQKSTVLPEGTVHLPDCMGLEKVSAQKKENQYAMLPNVSPDGGRIRYYSAGALEDPPSLPSAFYNAYVASRGGSGWTTSSAASPDPEVNAGGTGDIFSPDFSSWFYFASTDAQSYLGAGQIYRGGLGEPLTALSPLLMPTDSGTHGTGNLFGAQLHAASADHSHFYFWPGELTTAYLPGDPEPAGSEAVANAYVALLDQGEPKVELLARDGAGNVWGGRCGAYLGGISDINASNRNQGAISANGSSVYFTARPSQPTVGNCDPNANKRRILRRVEAPAGPSITQLIISECVRVAPACSSVDGDDLYQGASIDQTKVYFLTTRQLADTDLDTGPACSRVVALQGCDLYLYDSSEPAGQRLTQVSAGDATNPTPGEGAKVFDQSAAISGDGSHVYYVAEGVITTDQNPQGDQAQADQPNLYLYQRDDQHPNGRTAFIATVSSGDSFELWNSFSFSRGAAYPVPQAGKDANGNDIGGDGHILLFQSKASLTADDMDGGFRDVFRYDSASEKLERISKAEPGGADNGHFDVARGISLIGLSPVGRFRGTDYAEEGRWVSEDGETVVFKTNEGLVPADQNGFMDSYMLRGGRLYRLPGTSDPMAGQSYGALNDRPTLSHDGSTVAFTSNEPLDPADGDSAIDVYSLRVYGGYPIVPDPKTCVGEECQGGLGALPNRVSAASAHTASAGNVNAKRRACPKGKRRVRRAGKTRCVKKASKAKRKAKKRAKRAGRKQGGQK